MLIACPRCGSRNLRYARLHSFAERCWTWLGIRPLRCRDCRFRFVDRTWRLTDWRFARCPHCWRMDLALWSERGAHVGMFADLSLRLGAKPYRCEYCRINFISFRQRHEKFSFKRWSKLRKPAGDAGAPPSEGGTQQD
ncbi:MAG: hypothetical protein ACLQGV_00835 [Bryobacteraceae bacterium]